MKKVACFAFPIFIAIITVIGFNVFFDKNIKVMLESKELTSIDSEYGSIYKDKGLVYNNYIGKNNYLLLQGSSELSIPIPQNPAKFFPIEGIDHIATDGRAGSQPLIKASILGSQKENNENRKIVLMVSLQWFQSEDGEPKQSFQGNFAPVQFYNFLQNEKISEENKKKYASRIDSLLTGSDQFQSEKLCAKLYASDKKIYKAINFLFKPYFLARKNIVELKDKALLYNKLKTMPDKREHSVKKVNWDEEYEKAEEEGKTKVTNNDFMLPDDAYNQLKTTEEKERQTLKTVDLLTSKEFDDYKLYLDICNELGMKPYIILIPTSGKWYDNVGLDQKKREEFYDKAEKIAEEKGFEVLNLKDEEYSPYFMYDESHLGWKGWLKVDEEIYKHFKKG